MNIIVAIDRNFGIGKDNHLLISIPEDLKYDLKATARMDVNLTGNITFGPYISYRRGQSRASDSSASNTMIGVSLTYKDLFNIF